jgi:hypothetical protein
VQLLLLGRPRVLVDAVILPERPERDKLLVAVLEELGGRRGIGTHVGLELVADLERRGLRWIWGEGGARDISKASFQSHQNTWEKRPRGMSIFGATQRRPMRRPCLDTRALWGSAKWSCGRPLIICAMTRRLAMGLGKNEHVARCKVARNSGHLTEEPPALGALRQQQVHTQPTQP